MKRLLRVGSRESKLAVIQARLVMETIQRHHPEVELELVTMKTSGDIILDRNLDEVGGKGLFVKELDLGLRSGQIDFAVHSLKDMPMETPEDLPIVALTARETPFDALVMPEGVRELDLSKPFGCSSARRRLQLEALYPGMTVKGIRGNVLLRLSKVDSGDYAATVLACAGLSRLSLQNRITRVFSEQEMIPAAGQGILAVQARAGEDHTYLRCVDDTASRIVSAAEGEFVRLLNGGCSSPIAAYARLEGEGLRLFGLYYDEESGRHVTGSTAGPTQNAAALGAALAQQLKCKIKECI